MKTKSHLVVAMVLTFGTANITSAYIVEIEFEGTVTAVDSHLSSAFIVGDSVVGYYSYETDTVNTHAGGGSVANEHGIYECVSVFTITLGSYEATSNVGALIYVGDDLFGNRDRYVVSTSPLYVDSDSLTGADVGGAYLRNWEISFDDMSKSVFSDASMPIPFPDLSRFNLDQSHMTFRPYSNPSDAYFVNFEVSSLTVVPEPAMLALVAVGGLVLVKSKRK